MESQLAREIDMLYNQVCHALGDPKRLMILYVLDRKPYSVTELAAELDTPQPTISRHLKILRERALVETQREGASVYYSLADKRMIKALDLMRGMVRDRILAQASLADFAALDAGRPVSDEDV
jgi:DNA-binding transcriptional ArsR family regulator